MQHNPTNCNMQHSEFQSGRRRSPRRMQHNPTICSMQNSNSWPFAAAGEGFTLDECVAIYGDQIAHVVWWKDGDQQRSDLSELKGKPVRLRFVMQEADLYSIRFPETSE